MAGCGCLISSIRSTAANRPLKSTGRKFASRRLPVLKRRRPVPTRPNWATPTAQNTRDVPQFRQPGFFRQAERRMADVGAENAAGAGCLLSIGAGGFGRGHSITLHSGGGPPHSKTFRISWRLRFTRERPGVRQPSGAFGRIYRRHFHLPSSILHPLCFAACNFGKSPSSASACSAGPSDWPSNAGNSRARVAGFVRRARQPEGLREGGRGGFCHDRFAGRRLGRRPRHSLHAAGANAFARPSEMLPALKRGAIVTDVGSVKASVVRELESLVAKSRRAFCRQPSDGRRGKNRRERRARGFVRERRLRRDADEKIEPGGAEEGGTVLEGARRAGAAN